MRNEITAFGLGIKWFMNCYLVHESTHNKSQVSDIFLTAQPAQLGSYIIYSHPAIILHTKT